LCTGKGAAAAIRWKNRAPSTGLLRHLLFADAVAIDLAEITIPDNSALRTGFAEKKWRLEQQSARMPIPP